MSWKSTSFKATKEKKSLQALKSSSSTEVFEFCLVPGALCRDLQRLRKVTLPEGLTGIENRVFQLCPHLLEIKIGRIVEFIGEHAFPQCTSLTKVEFESTTPSPHQLRTICRSAFWSCSSLQRIKLPASVTSLGWQAIADCTSLVEANLSTTGLTEISGEAFCWCGSLQIVSLPNTLERICNWAFYDCSELVTVVVQLENSQPIKIGDGSFEGCRRLAVLVLPKDSTAEEDPEVDPFYRCELLRKRYGQDCSGIVAGLVGRFDGYSIHRMCYDHSLITIQELRQCIAEQQEGDSLVDAFGMTPFHVFFSTAEPKVELLDVLLDSLPNHILLKLKDANDRRPLDYLIANWNDGNATLLQRTLQKWVIDRVARWGVASRTEAMKGRVQEILAEDNMRSRATLCNEVCAALERYENVEATSILEMALWKWKLKSGWSNDGSKRQALDREGCRCLSGSNVVIPSIATWLGIPRPSSRMN